MAQLFMSDCELYPSIAIHVSYVYRKSKDPSSRDFTCKNSRPTYRKKQAFWPTFRVPSGRAVASQRFCCLILRQKYTVIAFRLPSSLLFLQKTSDTYHSQYFFLLYHYNIMYKYFMRSFQYWVIIYLLGSCFQVDLIQAKCTKRYCPPVLSPSTFPTTYAKVSMFHFVFLSLCCIIL